MVEYNRPPVTAGQTGAFSSLGGGRTRFLFFAEVFGAKLKFLRIWGSFSLEIQIFPQSRWDFNGLAGESKPN